MAVEGGSEEKALAALDKPSHLVDEFNKIEAEKAEAAVDSNEYTFKISRPVRGWTISMDVVGTAEDALAFMDGLDGLFGGAVANAPAQTAAPVSTYDAPVTEGEEPMCPKHNVAMRSSKFGGFYCTAADTDNSNGYCREKIK